MLILSSTGAGLFLSNKSRMRMIVCRELISFCDGLLLDLNYKVTPAAELIEKVIISRKLKHLKAVDKNYIIRQKCFVSPLNQRDNEEVSAFLFSFGKSDVKTQIKLINDFKEYINTRLNEYTQKHIKDSKLYVSFGVFFGLVFSFIWS